MMVTSGVACKVGVTHSDNGRITKSDERAVRNPTGKYSIFLFRH